MALFASQATHWELRPHVWWSNPGMCAERVPPGHRRQDGATSTFTRRSNRELPSASLEPKSTPAQVQPVRGRGHPRLAAGVPGPGGAGILVSAVPSPLSAADRPQVATMPASPCSIHHERKFDRFLPEDNQRWSHGSLCQATPTSLHRSPLRSHSERIPDLHHQAHFKARLVSRNVASAGAGVWAHVSLVLEVEDMSLDGVEDGM
jgi:hypothetical protein